MVPSSFLFLCFGLAALATASPYGGSPPSSLQPPWAVSWLWWECRAASAHWLLHADLGGDEELLHGHRVHPGEVLLHQLLAVVPVAQAEVLLKVDPELRDHDGVLQVSLNPVKTLDALVTSVLSGGAGPGGLANMESSIDKVVLHNCEEHPDVVLGEGVLAEVLSSGGVEGGTVVVADVVVDGDRSHLHHCGKPVHLPDTFLTGEPCLWSSRCHSDEGKEKSDPGNHSYSLESTW